MMTRKDNWLWLVRIENHLPGEVKHRKLASFRPAAKGEHQMKKLFWILCLSLLTLSHAALAETPRGKMSGGRAHELPGWFKSSFLNFKEDAEEARAAGKHLLIFMDLNDCPYCARTLDENFRTGDNMAFIQKHFDVVAVNVRGAGEITWLDGTVFSERDLASRLKVVGTPTLVFINPDGEKVLQLNGYRTPSTLRLALEFVQGKAYRNQSLATYVEARQKGTVYTLRSHPSFENVTDFTGYKKPLAVIFEDRTCTDCAGFHDKVLNHPDVQPELKKFRVVRLDALAETPITDIDGQRTTPRAWAAALKLTHRPGMVLFDEGREATRMEGRLYKFHFKELLRFVSSGAYKRYERFGFYLDERQQEIINQGTNIDFSE